MNLYTLLIVGLGGFAGSTLRFLTVRLVDSRLNALFPFGTLTVNVIGSFILGIIYMLATRQAGISENARLFLAVGFCGGFTTFSAFSLDAVTLWERGQGALAATYVAGSVLVSLLAVLAGVAMGRGIFA